MAKLFDFVRNKFRQSKDYTQEMLIRDLLESFREVGNAFEAVGSWTPTLFFGTGTTGITYTTQRGTYTKVGRLAFVDFEILLTSKGTSTGSAEIRGLPSIIGNAGTRPGIITTPYYTSMALTAGSIMSIMGYGDASGLGLQCRQMSNTGTSDLTDAHFTNTSRIIAGGVWLAAA